MDTKIEEKWIKHYSNHHKILLVGEGDFSFALCLANAFGSASNMVATSRDSKGLLIMKYSRGFAILEELETLGCSIVHEVDAHSVHNHPMLQNQVFDRIVYNFPHAGFGLAENNLNQIGLHQEVVLGFLKSAKKMLTIDGEIHITHKNNKPFSKWEIVKCAEKIGLIFVEKVPFNISDYPGYVNKRGSGENCDGTFPIGDSSTFKFSKPKYVKAISLGLLVVLEDPDSVQLINYASKIMLASKIQKARRIDSKMEERWITHYSSCHKILLVGEGDFSFALSLARAFCSASNMVATSLDSEETLKVKYSRATINQIELKRFGCTILHEVDALAMDQHPLLLGKIFDRIIFNFPQANVGFALNKIWLHQEVVLGFLKSAKKMLTNDGEIHITHKNNIPFSKWEIVKLAEKIGLVLVEKVPFIISDYPGYVNKRGSGENCDGTFITGDSSTSKFSKPKYVKPISLGLLVVLEEPESVQLKNDASKVMLASKMMEERWITHYSSRHKILLVGEGDFSFALCLARAFDSAFNMVATSLDSKESLNVKYSRATINQMELKRFGCTILHEVDALTMDQNSLLVGKIFDRIVFNFPQDVIGFVFGKIQNHQKLVLGFLQNARKMLSRDGEVHVTLNCTNPFNKWEVEKLAEKAGLVLVKKVPFKMQEYPCYTNKRGSGLNWDENFNVGYNCSTFKFSKAKVVAISEISADRNLLRLKDTSECELKSSSEDHTVHVSTETMTRSSFNTAAKSNSVSMCTIL